MMTGIGSIGSAIAVTEITGHWVCAATLQLRTQYISSELVSVCSVRRHIIQFKAMGAVFEFASTNNRAGGIRTHGLHVPNVAL